MYKVCHIGFGYHESRESRCSLEFPEDVCNGCKKQTCVFHTNRTKCCVCNKIVCNFCVRGNETCSESCSNKVRSNVHCTHAIRVSSFLGSQASSLSKIKPGVEGGKISPSSCSCSECSKIVCNTFITNFEKNYDEAKQKELIKSLLSTKVGKDILCERDLEVNILPYFDENVKILIRKSSMAQEYLKQLKSDLAYKVFSKLWTNWFDASSKSCIGELFTHIEDKLALIPKKLLLKMDELDDSDDEDTKTKYVVFDFEKHIMNSKVDGNCIYVRHNNKWKLWWLVYEEWWNSYNPYKTRSEWEKAKHEFI